MHTDESKKFDKRNLERNVKEGIISRKDYDIYLSKLPDASDKVYDLEEGETDAEGGEVDRGHEAQARKRTGKKKVKGKGK